MSQVDALKAELGWVKSKENVDEERVAAIEAAIEAAGGDTSPAPAVETTTATPPENAAVEVETRTAPTDDNESEAE